MDDNRTPTEKELQEMKAKAPLVPNGTFTFSRNGNWRTFEIKTALAGKLKDKRILSLLSGSDNNEDFRGFAFVDDRGIYVWKDFRTSKVFMGYADIIWRMLSGRNAQPYLDKGYVVQASKRCVRCNRKLTTPESLLYGIGPVCAGRDRIRPVTTSV